MTSHDHSHHHTHGVINSTILTTTRGIWAVKWSFIGLLITRVCQAVIVYLSGKQALRFSIDNYIPFFYLLNFTAMEL